MSGLVGSLEAASTEFNNIPKGKMGPALQACRIIEYEVEPDCFKNMSEQEKSELLDLLNCEKFNFWRGYLCNIKNDEAYKEYWQKKAVISKP